MINDSRLLYFPSTGTHFSVLLMFLVVFNGNNCCLGCVDIDANIQLPYWSYWLNSSQPEVYVDNFKVLIRPIAYEKN